MQPARTGEALHLDGRESPRILKLGLEHQSLWGTGLKRATAYNAA